MPLRMRRALLWAFVIAASWGCDSTQPSVATSITIAPSELSFDAIGLQDTLIATVLDQRGNPMRNVPVTWSVEGSAVAVTPLPADSAVVTSAGDGTARVRAVAEGGTSGEVTATVARVPVHFEVVEGDGQVAIVGEALSQPIRVAVRDRKGFGIPGIAVTFAIVKGDGALAATVVESGEDGTASATWTLGLIAGPTQQLAVSAANVPFPLLVNARGLAGPPHTISIVDGDGQIGATDGTLPIAPTVSVRDQYGNGVANVDVIFQVAGTRGRVFPGGNNRTGGDGLARSGIWQLGSAPGTNTLRARIADFDLSVDFTATAVSPLRIEIHAGGGQVGRAGAVLPVPLSIIIRNKEFEPVGGVPVTFAVTEGGGSVANLSAVTNADGIASAGAWTLGPDPTRNRITVRSTAPTLEKQAPAIDSYGCSVGTNTGYGINLCFLTSVSASRRRIFETAAARWAGVIVGDLPDVEVSLANTCGTPANVRTAVDDLLILVSFISIDGPLGVLGQAGPCWVRSGSGLPFIGIMQFDQTDADNMEGAEVFESVILHEMAHVIGVGALWDFKGLLGLPSGAGVQNDTYFSGANANEAFDAIGGIAYTGGRKVPVENSGGSGTRNSHWRESVFRNELMTGFIDPTANPLSIVTLRSLEDLGYVVDRSRADPYSYSPALRRGGETAPAIPLGDDILDIPIRRTDAAGREVR